MWNFRPDRGLPNLTKNVDGDNDNDNDDDRKVEADRSITDCSTIIERLSTSKWS